MTALADLTDNEIAVTLDNLRSSIRDLEAEQARRQPATPMTANKVTEIRNALAEYDKNWLYDKRSVAGLFADYLRALLPVVEAAEFYVNNRYSGVGRADGYAALTDALKALE